MQIDSPGGNNFFDSTLFAFFNNHVLVTGNVVHAQRGHRSLDLDVLFVFSPRHTGAGRPRQVVDCVRESVCSSPSKNHSITAHNDTKGRIRFYVNGLIFEVNNVCFVCVRVEHEFVPDFVLDVVQLLRKSRGKTANVHIDPGLFRSRHVLEVSIALQLDGLELSVFFGCRIQQLALLKVPEDGLFQELLCDLNLLGLGSFTAITKDISEPPIEGCFGSEIRSRGRWSKREGCGDHGSQKGEFHLVRSFDGQLQCVQFQENKMIQVCSRLVIFVDSFSSTM